MYSWCLELLRQHSILELFTVATTNSDRRYYSIGFREEAASSFNSSKNLLFCAK
jgi:hypothetical protein